MRLSAAENEKVGVCGAGEKTELETQVEVPDAEGAAGAEMQDAGASEGVVVCGAEEILGVKWAADAEVQGAGEPDMASGAAGESAEGGRRRPCGR